jgi:hypothetical protein
MNDDGCLLFCHATPIFILVAGLGLFLVAIRTDRASLTAGGTGAILGAWPLLALTAILAVAVTYSALLFTGGSLDFLRGEDGPLEWAGAVALLVSSVLFLLAFVRSQSASSEAYGRLKRAIVLLLALAFLFAAGEEISWGQRILGIETPAQIKEVNRQDELNVHNAIGNTGRLSMNNLIKAFWFTFVVLVPVACVLSTRVRRTLRNLIPILPLWIAPLFLAHQLVAEIAGAEYGTRAVAELWETTSAVLFVLVAYAVYIDASQPSARQSEVKSPQVA